MIRTVLLAALIASVALPVIAQEHQGSWFGSGEGELTLDLNHVQDDIYEISINTIVRPNSDGYGSCAGGIDGEVILDSSGGNFFAENEDYDPEAPEGGLNRRYCEIGLSFNADGTLNTDERGGCLYYHGAACGFSGTLEHDAAGI